MSDGIYLLYKSIARTWQRVIFIVLTMDTGLTFTILLQTINNL